jgi:hypothetical protein
MKKEDLPHFSSLGEKKRRELDRYLKTSSTRSLITRFMILQVMALDRLKYEKEVGRFASWPGITAKEIHRMINRTFRGKVSVHTIYKPLNTMRYLSWTWGKLKGEEEVPGSIIEPPPGWSVFNFLTFKGEKELERITYLLRRKKKLPAVRPGNPYEDLPSHFRIDVTENSNR